jgi:hypothetical protein
LWISQLIVTLVVFISICFLNRDGVVQPCRIGEDGRPEPVGQVLELIEDISRQQIKPTQDED